MPNCRSATAANDWFSVADDGDQPNFFFFYISVCLISANSYLPRLNHNEQRIGKPFGSRGSYLNHFHLEECGQYPGFRSLTVWQNNGGSLASVMFWCSLRITDGFRS